MTIPNDLDAVIHQRVRPAIVSALAVVRELSLNELKEMLLLSHRAGAGIPYYARAERNVDTRIDCGENGRERPLDDHA